MGNRLTILAERLIECSNVADSKVIIDTVITALENVLQKDNQNVAKKVQCLVEQHYDLPEGSLTNSFSVKDRKLTEPKFIWVNVTLTLLKGNRQKTAKQIGNGVTKQKIYTCNKQMCDLENYFTQKEADQIRQAFQIIISSYE